MKKSVLQSLLLFLLVVLAACSTDSSSSGITSETQKVETTPGWHIELTVSGGFAGIDRQLLVDNTGSVSASDQKLGHRESNLSSAQLAELNNMLEALPEAAPQNESRFKSGRCADCILSRLSIDVGGKHYDATLRSGETTTQPYTDLFTYLSALLQRTLSSQ